MDESQSKRDRPIAERIQSYIDRELQTVPLSIRPEHVEADTRYLLLHVFQDWQDEEITISQEQDGVTNVLLKCTRDWKDQKKIVLVRIYGNATETMIYRDREMRNFVSLHLNGYAPKLLERFLNGLVYEFVPGRVLSKSEMADPIYAKAVARLLASWHRDMPCSEENQFWPIVDNWISQIPNETERSEKSAKTEIEKILRSDRRRSWLEANFKWLKDFACSVSNIPVFSHNDLLHANIIVQDDQTHAEGPSVAFIDYEYGCSNDLHFDIANHLLEFAGFECDWNALPSEALQIAFVEAYLQSYKLVEVVDRNEVLNELQKVRAYFGVSHFYWGTWALLQAAISKIDFDYETYGEKKLEAFDGERRIRECMKVEKSQSHCRFQS